jgi:hypothetical protein
MKCIKDLMAASRIFLELIALPRLSSSQVRKLRIKAASSCSRVKADGATLRNWPAYSKSN